MTQEIKNLLGPLVIATHNKGKLQEFKDLFEEYLPSIRLEGLSKDFELPQEEASSYFENALLKARYVGERLHRVAISDDSGLEVDALSGGPGVFSARFGERGFRDVDRVKHLLKELEGVPTLRRGARFVCCLVVFFPLEGKAMSFQGALEGRILEAPVGQSGFGYDPVFWVPEIGKTLAEISSQEKNRISHRFKAFMKMMAHFKGVSPKVGA